MRRQEINAALLKQRQSLMGFVYALTRDSELAEDIFQDVALTILDEAAAGTEVRSFQAWAREIARRRVANFYKRRGKHLRPAALGHSLIQTISSAFDEYDEHSVSSGLRTKFLRECVDDLPPRAREAVDRRYRRGMAVPEIAAVMTWKMTSVNTLLSKAKRTLAECIGRKLRLAEAG
jgi:RNA polymerase sigma-70 factor (ECF subfamily)